MARSARILAAVLAAGLAPAVRAGDVTGTIHFAGTPPAPAQLHVNKDPQVCGKTVADQSIEVSKGHLLGVVVTVKGPGLAKPPPLAAKAMLDQKLCHYVPHVQAAPVGSTLEIVNSDPMLHNIHGYLGAATFFNLAMPIKNQQIPRVLARPGVVHVKCDVHDFMSGWVLVVDSPYALVDGEGHYSIQGLPAGSYTVTAWHEKLGEKSAPVTVAASGAANVDFTYGK